MSTGVNPWPYEPAAISSSAWARLPERAEGVALENIARATYGAPNSAEIIAAPGTQAIIQWLPRLYRVDSVGVLGPTYDEHEKCWKTCGAKVINAASLDALDRCDVIVAVNPNNPDGRLYDPKVLKALAGKITARGGLLVVDEAFMDVVEPGFSLIPSLQEENVIVLRSFGKAYGLAGLRLGFAIAPSALNCPLREALGPWAVSGPALAVGAQALADAQWLFASTQRLIHDSGRLKDLLQSSGFQIVGGTPLFQLAQQQDAAASFDRLCRAGILTRAFEDRPNLLRFGVPPDEKAWRRLEAALFKL